MAGGFQAAARGLAHAPFQGDVWQLMLFLYALGPDATMEKLTQGIRDRRIDDAEASFLPAIASDRGNILRGLTESDTSFRARLKTALDDLKIAGSAWSVLRQVLGYVLSIRPRALTVSSTWLGNACDTSTWDEYVTGADTSKSPTHFVYSVGNWDWDSLSPSDGSWGWWRWYLVLEASDAPGSSWVGPAPKVGATGLKVGEPTYAVGVDAPSTVGKSLKIIVGQWKANWCDTIIVSFDGSYFDRTAPSGGGINPDGYFGRWAKLSGDVYVPARFGDVRYFRGPT